MTSPCFGRVQTRDRVAAMTPGRAAEERKMAFPISFNTRWVVLAKMAGSEGKMASVMNGPNGASSSPGLSGDRRHGGLEGGSHNPIPRRVPSMSMGESTSEATPASGRRIRGK